ncbi:MAG TPA: ABC transporter permease [Gemmatimonadales bacterium]|nr:ABC transporter permease [Gemmatimonadales bacterium]
MRNHPIVQLTVSRVREFYREPEAIFWVFGFPIVLAAALGLAFRNKGPGAINVGVQAGTGDSAVVASLKADSSLRPVILDSVEGGTRLRSGRIGILVIPGNPVVYRFDPTRDESRPAQLAVDRALQRAAGRLDPVATTSDHVTAKGSRYIDFLIPGLLGMNLLGSGIWGVGFAVVTARQKKLLKRFMATPMRKSHYLLGFILSRLVFLVVEVAALVGFGWLIFGVGVRGSWLALAGIALLGSLCFSGLGLLIASRARTVEGVSGLMNLAMLPMWILSGTFFSYSRFPDAMIPFVKALPLTGLNDALRAVMIDGTSVFQLTTPLAIVAVWGTVCFGVALKIFRWR